MASPEKRCLYEVLGLHRDCTADEIRSAYRKLALQRHPDKLVKSGVSESEATASFQELVNAYEVLSDARERAWYDSHRSQILFSGSNASNSSSSHAIVPDLFGFFSNSVFSGYSDTGRGFYKVYGDVFDGIYGNELSFAKKLGLGLGLGDVVKEAPVIGNLESPYAQVSAFYGYWLGFATVMDFGWADRYDAVAGVNRKSRRLMEEENKKVRRKARREYNDTVRGLAEFVKKRDKRVIDMQVKRNDEMERKKEEQKARKKEIEREKAERARAYEDPEWAKVEDDDYDEEEEEDEIDKKKKKKNELYCVACGKKFKSDKQWKNHEQSKKHKEKAAELRNAFGEEDRERGNDENGDKEEVVNDTDEFVSADEVHEEIDVPKNHKDYDEENQEIIDIDDGGKRQGMGVAGESKLGDDKDEIGALEAYVKVENEGVNLMEYNDKKGRKKRGGRKEGGNRAEEDKEEEHNQRVHRAELSSKVEQCDDDGQGDNVPPGKINVSTQAPLKKVAKKKDVDAKSKNASKGRKQKATSKSSSNTCDTCGEEFGSRNKLHKHLNDTGHATLKPR